MVFMLLMGFVALSVFRFLATLVFRESVLLRTAERFGREKERQMRIEGQPKREALFREQGEKKGARHV